jgi:hypothetical protein
MLISLCLTGTHLTLCKRESNRNLHEMSIEVTSEPELDCSYQYEALDEMARVPNFELSSPISSIGSNCSSPDRERTIQPLQSIDQCELNDSTEFVSLEELKSQILPPSDNDNSASDKINVLETIFEDCYLETPPGTPNTPRPNMSRRFRMNLSNFEEFKENVQKNFKLQPEDTYK